jgi:hypothetical protein
VVEGPIRAIEQPINLARHDEVVLMQSFDLLGAQRDSSIAPAEADVRVMAFWLGKLTNFHEEAHSMDDACTNWAEEFFSRMRSAEIGIHHHIAGAYLLRYAQERSWREGDNRRLSNGEQVNRLAALSLKRGKSVDFGDYWQRHSKDVHA